MTSGADDRSPRGERPTLEAVVAAAGGYVHPSDDLRPRVLEAAWQRHRRRRGQRRLLAIAGGLSGILILATSTWVSIVGNGAPTPVAATDLHQKALAVSAQTGADPAWSLYEVVVQWRRDQATRIDASCKATPGAAGDLSFDAGRRSP